MVVVLALVFLGLIIIEGLSLFLLHLNSWENFSVIQIPSLLRLRFGLVKRFLKVLNTEVDIQHFMRTFTKAEVHTSFDPALYSLTSAGKSGVDSRGFWADAKYSILLDKFGHGSIALIGFDIDDDIVLVKQIQGRQGYKEHLTPLKWERMLLAVVVQVARQSGLKEVRVQPAHKNKWHTVNERATNGRGKMLYDVTARRSGFKFDKEADCFRLALV